MAVPLAALVGVVAVRNAAVGAFAESNPAAAARIWSGHPDVAAGEAMIGIAEAAAKGATVPQWVFDRLGEASRKAPLAPQPFIVAGIRHGLEGKPALAEQAFVAARQRDPRSIPGRYFLAQHYLREGDLRGLQEVADLARLTPGGAPAIAPFLSQFARQPGAEAPMRRIFAQHRDIRAAVLSALASDAANAGLIIRLGGLRPNGDAPWVGVLVQSLVQAGQYGQAHAIWAKAAGLPGSSGSGLYDPDFNEPTAPAPFNWELASSAVGLAERRERRLHVIAYGDRDGILARQLAILEPAHYRLVAPLSGSAGGDSPYWLVRCANRAAGDPLSQVPAKTGVVEFSVPAECPAVWVEFGVRSSDIGKDSDVAVGPLRLIKVAAQ